MEYINSKENFLFFPTHPNGRYFVENVFSDIKVHPEIGNFKESPTGERYWTVCSGIFNKKEGDLANIYAKREDAINEYYKTIQSIKNVTGTLYWRKLPIANNILERWYVYSRFLITDKPIIQSADYKKI